jgi:DNA mismatch endonuclease, patch repair protein
MGRVKGKNTRPELTLRRLLHGMGYRFRLNRPDLPGSPDVVMAGRKTAIFVHGCFWHRHGDCKYCYTPKSNVEFWKKKFRENVERDLRVQEELVRMGWSVKIVWECELADTDGLRSKLTAYLDA